MTSRDEAADTSHAAAPRIGVLVVAYNAVTTLASVLDRIPADFRARIAEILICDDASHDATHLVALGYKQASPDLPITVIRHEKNLGYGGNQKAGYQLAIEHGLDIIVMLHGDGQYAPECIGDIVEPLVRGEADAVMGSRMMLPKAARRGGMPLYKYVGNKVLTRFENAVAGAELTEWHSGYRAYSVAALKSIPFQRNADGFNFDTQIIIQLLDRGKRIAEVPIPTYYGDEICYVDGLKYARDVSKDVVKYRLGKLGFSTGDLGSVGDEYAYKDDEDSSHGQILELLDGQPPSKVLDVGCGSGVLAERVRGMGHRVTGVDYAASPETASRVDEFARADLEQGIPAEVGTGFDVVIAADVLEHMRRPEMLLEEIRRVLQPGGVLIASVPNFGHWYPRLRTMLGIFDYDQRGILDRTHYRFFTRKSVERLIRDAGFEVRRRAYTGLPFAALSADKNSALRRAVHVIDRLLVSLRPTVFAYQFVLHLELPTTSAVSTASGGKSFVA
ncbi:MAG TPA: bifunctional glycosyltransferase/class I SAM-dependent methyltransferase [Mycobacteriales bacterium]|nr:bifunctional glycosyltransferase/class I SAM-dependent methyltransferase [Mycobacteriales bacterium]